jgi:DNA-directed RNA polymerase specialized sigma24 family protein
MRSFKQRTAYGVPRQDVLREEPLFTKLAFNRLLQWLDDGVDSHGERYLDMRRRLVAYFDRRHRPAPDELADETLGRIVRTLERNGVIDVTPPARYCYVVARFVLLEDLRRNPRHVPLDAPRRVGVSRPHRRDVVGPDDNCAVREQCLECLDRCLNELRPEDRELVVEYYRDTRRQLIERRRDLAQRLGISMNALAIRAFRIRDALRTCMKASSTSAREGVT